MPQIGDEFRAAREARHLSLSEVSEQLHIRSVYLGAIESEEWASIGAPVYVRGFIRTYARFLGLEPEPAVEYYNMVGEEPRAGGSPPIRTRSRTGVRAAVPARAPGPARAGGPSPWLWLAALAAAILVGFVGYNSFELRAGRERPAGAGIAGAPAPAASSKPHPAFRPALAAANPTAERNAAAGPRRTLEVYLTQTSWLSVQVDGEKRLEGTYPAGTRRAFHGKLADVRTGNAGGVQLTVNGKDLGAMGHAGGVSERSIALSEE